MLPFHQPPENMKRLPCYTSNASLAISILKIIPLPAFYHAPWEVTIHRVVHKSAIALEACPLF
jgi:hypothetical protein